MPAYCCVLPPVRWAPSKSAARRATGMTSRRRCWAPTARCASVRAPSAGSRTCSYCCLRRHLMIRRRPSYSDLRRRIAPRLKILSSASEATDHRAQVARTHWPPSRSPRRPRSPRGAGSPWKSWRMSETRRLTMAQALVSFLEAQYTERDGQERPFFAGCFGIFGHGNLAGIGQALQQAPRLRYYQSRNEQAQVHIAIGYAKMSNRLQTLACTSSIGPGATNMLTGAATATINQIPVLLLPGDMFARRNVAPVLQQLESERSQDVSVNDCFKPVSRYWDRISRPEQLLTSLPEAMRVLTSPAETGAVTLALPEDVQTEAFGYPTALFEKRVWRIPRNRPDRALLQLAAQWIREARQPLVVAGGGVIYSEATDVLRALVDRTCIPVRESTAGQR